MYSLELCLYGVLIGVSLQDSRAVRFFDRKVSSETTTFVTSHWSRL